MHDADTYALYLDHLEILQAIQNNYHKILENNNYIDQSLLPSTYKINEDYLRQFENIEIFYEGYFSKFEFEIIQKISQILNLKIICNINEFNTKNIEIFKQININLEQNYKYIIDLTNNEIVLKIPIVIKKYDAKIVAIPQRILQIGFIKQKIYKMITKDKIDPNKIVVVLPDEKFSKTLSLFDDEKYFNFAMGNKTNNSKIKKVISTINKILLNYEPKDKDKIDLFNIDKEILENLIKPNWNKKISKDVFIMIFDYLISCETNEEILDNLNELKLSLIILFFYQAVEINLKDIFKIISNKLDEIVLDDISGGKITVLGLLETRGISFDGVIVVDFNDSLVPKKSIKNKFISTQVKEFANLPTNRHREDLQKYYYKMLFDNAKKIAISYVDDDLNTISRFVSQIFKDIHIDKSNQDFSKILYTSKQHQRFQKEIILDIDLSQKSWSATSLKTFLQCKRRYYFHYILKIKEHKITLKPASFELGNIIHKILEKLANQNNINQITLNNELSKYQNSNPYLTMELEIWKRKLENFCSNETARIKNGVKIFEVEKAFEFSHNDIKLTGKIDRIDKLENANLEILDYKTSSNLKIDSIKNFEKSCDFQLEFYYLSQKDKIIESVGYYDLNDGKIKKEIVLDEKIKLLDEKLKQLKTTQVNFNLCEDKAQCIYCPYKIMCERE